MKHTEDFNSDSVDILFLLIDKLSLRNGKLEFDISAVKTLSAHLLDTYSKGAADTIVELNYVKNHN